MEEAIKLKCEKCGANYEKPKALKNWEKENVFLGGAFFSVIAVEEKKKNRYCLPLF